MDDCPLKEDCLFYQGKMKVTEEFFELYKQGYCCGDFSKCAKYYLVEKLDLDHVPPDIYPDARDSAYGKYALKSIRSSIKQKNSAPE